MDQIIIHVDMDAFFAAVEVRDDSTLRGKPLVIGALPHERGVVSTCSYEARAFGIRSGMNIKDAYRLCPNAIYMHPNIDKYKAVSERLHAIWNDYASALEAIAFDEAYLDVQEKAGDLEGARRIAHAIKHRTRDELDLTCSVGIAYSKTAAKTASEERKPDGYFEICSPQEFVDLVDDRDVRVLYTVGEMTAAKLHAAGIDTVRDVRENADDVIALLGKQGTFIVNLAHGIDDRKVTPWRPEDAKSIGREVTFQQDVSDFSLLDDVLVLLALCVERRIRRVGLHGGGVTLKLTYADMKGITRSQATTECETALQIHREASHLLKRVEHRPVRLVGVSVYKLTREESKQLRLDTLLEVEKNQGMEQLLDRLQTRYGLDFAGNLDKIYAADILHRTVEYMRKHAKEAPIA